MSGLVRRWVLFLSGVVCAIWLLAIHAFVDPLLRQWPGASEVPPTPLCERDIAVEPTRSWKLRTQPGRPPITATAIPVASGGWGLLLRGIHDDDTLFAMGFRDGDVLIELDGWRLSSPRAALAAYGRILADDADLVNVARGSSTVTLAVGPWT